MRWRRASSNSSNSQGYRFLPLVGDLTLSADGTLLAASPSMSAQVVAVVSPTQGSQSLPPVLVPNLDPS